MMMERVQGDRPLMILTLLLLVIGLVMIYSSSAVLAIRRYDDSLFFFRRQILWALIGLSALFAVSRIPYTFWRAAVFPMILGIGVLLVLVLIPGIGVEVNGSRRWLRVGSLTIQPSELARLASVIYLAAYLGKKPDRLEVFFRGCLPPVLVIGILLALIMGESDLGTAVVIGMVAGLMFFIGGARWRHLWVMGLLTLPVLYTMIMNFDFRKVRLLSFWDPWKDPLGSGFQIIQSFLSLGSGGVAGIGLGEGHQKLFFLPFPHTDFIFAVIGEELGLIGTWGVLFMFGMLAWRGIAIALKTSDPFARYLAFGLTMMISVQAVINMGVVTGLLPTKGLTLPFLSYGGSSLVVNLIGVGILLNIAKTAPSGRSIRWSETIRSKKRIGQAGRKVGAEACGW